MCFPVLVRIRRPHRSHERTSPRPSDGRRKGRNEENLKNTNTEDTDRGRSESTAADDNDLFFFFFFPHKTNLCVSHCF